MEEKKKVCSEEVEQNGNVAPEDAGKLTDEEMEEAAGGSAIKWGQMYWQMVADSKKSGK